MRPLVEEIRNPPRPEDLFESFKDRAYSFFLDGASDQKNLARYSFIGCEPFLVFKSKGDRILLNWYGGRIEELRSNPFLVLRDLFKRYRVEGHPDIPFTAGAVGYFGYDLKSFVERLPDIAKDDLDLDDSVFGFYDTVIIHDSLKKKAYIASSGLPFLDAQENKKRACERLECFKDIIDYSPAERKASRPLTPPAAISSNFSKSSYMKAIVRAKEYIKQGDIYQVNLSQRFEADFKGDPYDLYLRLRGINPAPFSSFLGFDGIFILSSSPERFLLKRKDYIETRPIKGTRPRGSDGLSDTSLEKELIDSPKDRAEHLMIVDLERNDLGRICEYGSVRSSEFITMEKYSTVFHLVSTVSGRLKKGIGPIESLMAAFPGGSITGAPKIRAMEIIEELEPVKRAVYTGAIGYISFDGNMDTSIVIRTFIVKDERAFFQVGGGIVADSDPEKEYDETIDKARALFKSLGVAETGIIQKAEEKIIT